MELDLNQLRELLATLDQTGISELTLKGADFELTVRRGESTVAGGSRLVTSSVAAEVVTPVMPGPSDATLVPSPPPTAPPTATPAVDSKCMEVISPMVGTFYRAAAPGEAPFVEVGDRITLGQTVCIIEAMKLMNEIEAEVAGQVIEILVQNGEPVEYNQPLMRIKPN